MAAAKSGIHDSQAKGAVVGGTPAIPAKAWMKSSGVFTRLPEMLKEQRRLRKEIEDLKTALKDNSQEQRGK